MKVKKKPMPIVQKVFYVLSFFFLIFAFCYLGMKDYTPPISHVDDAAKFTEEYGITSQNVFHYKTSKEILELLNSGSGIIFLCYPENSWCSSYADLLNDIAIQNKVKEIYYYNISQDRTFNQRYYENIVKILESYLPVIEDNETNIYVPALILVKDGEIIKYDDETAIVKGKTSVTDYWTNERKMQKRNEMSLWFKQFLEVSS